MSEFGNRGIFSEEDASSTRAFTLLRDIEVICSAFLLLLRAMDASFAAFDLALRRGIFVLFYVLAYPLQYFLLCFLLCL